MPSSRVERDAVLCVDPNIRRRGELAGCRTPQDAIQATKYLPGIIGLSSNGLRSHFDHRRNERGRNAMSRNVCYKDSQMIVVSAYELVEIARNGSHGKVRC